MRDKDIRKLQESLVKSYKETSEKYRQAIQEVIDKLETLKSAAD